MPPDPDLLRRYADDRDETAFAELVRRHLGLVHATALRLVNGDRHLAQDVAQTVFTELARQARALADRATLAGWLHTTARFLASKAARAERRRREREQEAHAMNETDTTPDAAWQHFAPVLDDAVAALDDADRDALLLRFFSDQSHREVGAQLGLTEDAARMRVARALDKLREHFSKRGVATTAALLSLTLGVHGSTPAPAGLAANIAAKSLAAVAAATQSILATKWLAAAAVATVAIILFWPTKPDGPAATAPSSASIPVASSVNPTVVALPPGPLPPPSAPLPNSPAPPMNTATLAAVALLPVAALAADYESAAQSTNQTGLDLFRLVASADPGANALISPYSIQSALAMTYAGADGVTRAEMARVLHYPADDAALAASFKELRAGLDNAVAKSAQAIAANRGRRAGAAAPVEPQASPVQPIEWHVANRLFGQPGYAFRPAFLNLVRDGYSAPFQPLDFKAAPEPARLLINQWVAEQTKGKILDLLPPPPAKIITEDTRLVLVNALYLKAPWAKAFVKQITRDRPFKVRGTTPAFVPTMTNNDQLGYAKREGYTAVTLPYLGGELQFLILLPDDPAGVAALAASITPTNLRENTKLESRQVTLSLPKFKLEGPSMELAENLKLLGMKTAFDEPPGSANFDRMAPRKPSEYLYISKVIHKTFIALDEDGTEASAATAVVMSRRGGGPPASSVVVNVDRPFLFAIQHRASGACLFLGRVTDPR
jgi:serpin B